MFAFLKVKNSIDYSLAIRIIGVFIALSSAIQIYMHSTLIDSLNKSICGSGQVNFGAELIGQHCTGCFTLPAGLLLIALTIQNWKTKTYLRKKYG